MDKSEKIILFVVIGVIGGCILLAIACGGLIFLIERISPAEPTELPTPQVLEPQYQIVTATATTCELPPQGEANSTSIDDTLLAASEETLSALENTIIPTADLNQLAEKFYGKESIPTQLFTPPQEYQIGDRINFYKMNDSNDNVLTSATLRYATDNVYFWAEEGIYTDKRDLKNLMDTFAYEIYPTDQEFFGTEWIPGVDNDPHLSILYAAGLGSNLAGYASTADGVLPEAHEYSNVKEMFTINADVQTLTDEYTLSVMAHELQHVIHGYHDPNEELWVNEGFSELATLLNGYSAGGFDYVFTSDPDMQLNNWSDDPDLNDSNYGASFLYTTYLLDRFGEEITRAVVADPLNGFTSVDNVLATNHVTDPISGEIVTADNFFADWTIANLLQDSLILDGRYTYSNYPEAPQAGITESLYDCSGTTQTSTVHQYGTDYYELGCSGDYEIQFSGDATVGVLPDSVGTDGYMMWSNRADTSDMMMTKDFDFTNVSGPITMTFDVWYDLENDFDYVYLMASENGGDWQIIKTTSCTSLDPSGNSYGCGYNGQSFNWQSETVNLSKFAGEKVSLRFEYVTDGALNYEGFAIDNISIPEASYYEGFEASEGGWIPEGFVRIQNTVPQTFLVSLITKGSPNPVQKFEVAPGEVLSININGSCYNSNPILVVSGSSRYSRQMATYHLRLTER